VISNNDVWTRLRRRRGISTLSLSLAVAAVAVLAVSAGARNVTRSSAHTASITPSVAVANAEKFLAPYTTAPVTWQGPATSPPVAKDKHIVWIDIQPQLPTLQTQTAAAQQAAKTLHWTLTTIDVSATETFEQAVQQAISLHPSGVFFSFEDVASDPAAFAALRAAHIPVIALAVSTDPANADKVTHIVNNHFNLQGELPAAAAVVASKGDSHFGVFITPSGSETDDEIAGFKDYFAQYGGGSVTAIDYVDPDILFNTAEIGQAAVAFIQAHPSITQLFVAFDAVAAEVIPALKQAGLLSRVGVESINGDAYNINLIRTGGGQIADAVFPYRWNSYAAFDDFNRIFNHVALPKDDGVPIRLFDKSDLYSGNGYWDGGYNFVAKYDSLWKAG
jgi:ribose transport system substrate-binding protein